MAGDRLTSAIDTTARRVIGNVALRHIELEDDLWGQFPDIGECDWELVIDRAHDILNAPPTEAELAAYEYLQRRCDG